ncbi:MAG: SDR family oxidoreductase [Bacteroidales bacterium]|nr:SDR family oxidoreductase [Bacteroidales bacterium]
MRCYLVTGGTGFIGQRLVRLLSDTGATVHVLSRNIAKKEMFPEPKVHFFTGDILDPEAVARAMEGCTHIYHLAGYARGWARDENIYFEYNVRGTENILQIAKDLGVEKIVYTSTAGVINPSAEVPATEDTPRTTPFFTPYDLSKYQAEQTILKYVRQGLNVVITNPSRVFGPGPLDENNAVTGIILNYKQGKWHFIPGSGKRYGNYVYVDDVVNGLTLAMKKGMAGERYILGGENLSYRRFFREISLSAGRKNLLLPIPLSVMLVVSWGLSAGARIFNFHPLITPDWVKKYFFDWKLSSEKAHRELGYEYTPFREALHKTVLFLDNSS